jgi:hypothetical protein
MERVLTSVSESDRAELERLIRGRNTPQKVVLRAKIVVLTADGTPTSEIVEQLKTSKRAWTVCGRMPRVPGGSRASVRGRCGR